jgi:spore coat polysaccharide biosynthesis protein SpsF (cytidylyltransferase family)
MSRTVAFIQARTSSSRFPGKVLEPLAGEPMIVFMARRVQRAARLDDVVVVTSVDASDDALCQCLHAASVPVFRGSLDDVLARFCDAARAHPADVYVRLTGDCPLIDPAVIDAVVECRVRDGVDYATNTEPPTFPDGLDVECFTSDSLTRAGAHARLASQREHATLWMRSPDSGLSRSNVAAPADLSALRLTVDYPDDLAVVRAIVAEAAPGFDLYDVLRILAHRPQLLQANRHTRNEGLAASLAREGTPHA